MNMYTIYAYIFFEVTTITLGPSHLTPSSPGSLYPQLICQSYLPLNISTSLLTVSSHLIFGFPWSHSSIRFWSITACNSSKHVVFRHASRQQSLSFLIISTKFFSLYNTSNFLFFILLHTPVISFHWSKKFL